MAMLNWQGWAANFLGWGSEGSATPEPTTQSGAGGGSSRRRRRKQFLEVEGKYYEVASQREAEAILARLRNKAQKTAQTAVRKAQQERKGSYAPAKTALPAAPHIALREPDFGDVWAQQLQAKIDAANAAIADIYRRAIEEWQRQEEEDDDVATLLAMGIL